MKKIILSLSILCVGCGSQVGQNVSVIVNANESKQVSPLETFEQLEEVVMPQKNEAQPDVSSPISAPTPSISLETEAEIKPEVTLPVGLTTSEITELFKTTVPQPENVKTYMRTEIRAAEEGFKSRYEASKSDPIAVTKIMFDALLLSNNPELSQSLLSIIATEPNPESRFCQSKEACLGYIKGGQQDIAYTVYRADFNSRLKTFSLKNFEQREVSFVRFLGSEAIDVHNPQDLVPESPSENEILTLSVKCIGSTDLIMLNTMPAEIPDSLAPYYSPAYTKMSAWDIKFVFEQGSWRVLPESIALFNTTSIN